VACYLLHVLEQQDPHPYGDADVKDVVGTMPQFFCTHCQPILRLTPGDAMKCINREAPCWMHGGPQCTEKTVSPDTWDPTRQ